MRRPEAILLDAGGVLQLPSLELINAAIAPSRRRRAAIDRACYAGGAAYSRAVRDCGIPRQCQTAFVRAYVAALNIPNGSRGSVALTVQQVFAQSAALWTRTVAPSKGLQPWRD
jgi:hypothetical protein